jgi:cytochrome P450
MENRMDGINQSSKPMGPVVRTSTPKALVSLIRNPLDALPPAIFSEPIVFSKMGGDVKIYIADPALIHEALVKNADALGKGEQVRRALGPALGQGLLTADGAHWKWQRQSAASAFRHDKLLDLQPAMISAAEATRDRWLEMPSGKVDVGHEMMRTTFDIIVETMMSGGHGIDVGKVEKSISDFLGPTGWTFAFSVVGAPEWMPYPGRRKSRAAVTFLRSSLAGVIADRRKSGEDRHDLVSMLLAAVDPETGRTMSDEEIVDNLMTFITAGHETTALGLAWTFDLLARHPECKERVISEIDAVTAGAPLASEHIAKLTYTRQVFSEAMRLYPPAPVITRTAMQDFRLGGFHIPAGTVMYVPIYAVHHHRSIWKNPEAFDPERFTPENTKQRHRYAYMPFGAGPRVCIGSAFAMMEGVAVLSVLLKTFHLSSTSATSPTPVMKVTLRPKQRLLMHVEKRHA